jgi:hypothetical protein
MWVCTKDFFFNYFLKKRLFVCLFFRNFLFNLSAWRIIEVKKKKKKKIIMEYNIEEFDWQSGEF